MKCKSNSGMYINFHHPKNNIKW